MADIPEEKIAEVRDRLDIVAVIGRSVALKQAGRSWKGLCPFHQEKTPSFHVDPDRKLYHCFGCKAGGDVFRFMMEYEGRTFPETVRGLAAEVGVLLPEPDVARDPHAEAERRKRDVLREANERAAAVFAEWLHRDPAGEGGRRYLSERGIGEEMVRRFGLGFAPLRNDLRQRLVRAGVSEQVIEEAGLLARRDRDLYERFRGRLMVPIRDQDGRAIAFGARLVEGEHPAKYLNSPETPLYRKSATLFGLPEARPHIRREGAAIVVEGYFDVIALVQAGIGNVVATCGTALTKDHCRILAKQTRDVLLVFDGDEAGTEAAVRTYEVVSEVPGVTVRVVSLPADQDPDTFVRERGADAFRELCAAALPLLEVLIERAMQGVGRAIEDRVRAVERVRPFLDRVHDPLTHRVYLQRIGERLGLDERTLQGTLRSRPRQAERESSAPLPRQEVQQERPFFLPADEEALCLLLLEQPSLLEHAGVHTGIYDLSEDRVRSLIGRLIDEWRRRGAIDVGALLEQIPDSSLTSRWRGHIASVTGLSGAAVDGTVDQERLTESTRKLDLILGRLARQAENRNRQALAIEISGISDPVERARMIQAGKGRTRHGAGKSQA